MKKEGRSWQIKDCEDRANRFSTIESRKRRWEVFSWASLFLFLFGPLLFSGSKIQIQILDPYSISSSSEIINRRLQDLPKFGLHCKMKTILPLRSYRKISWSRIFRPAGLKCFLCKYASHLPVTTYSIYTQSCASQTSIDIYASTFCK